MVSGTCITIASLVKDIYTLSLIESNMSNFVFYVMYIPGNFLSIYILGRWGLKVSIVIGVLFLLIGSWVRLFVMFTGTYGPYMIGSVIAALG